MPFGRKKLLPGSVVGLPRGARAAAATVLALMASFALTGTSAYAGESTSAKSSYRPPGPHYEMHTDDDRPGGVVHFSPITDYVYTCDMQSDGAYVKVVVTDVTLDPDRYVYSLFDTKNDYTCTRAVPGGVHNLAERHCFRFDIMLLRRGRVIDISRDSSRWRNLNDREENC